MCQPPEWDGDQPQPGVEVPVLADQDFKDMFLADTWARLGRGALREHDHVASLPSTVAKHEPLKHQV